MAADLVVLDANFPLGAILMVKEICYFCYGAKDIIKYIVAEFPICVTCYKELKRD